jgi:hypothetical protein
VPTVKARQGKSLEERNWTDFFLSPDKADRTATREVSSIQMAGNEGGKEGLVGG